MLWILCRVTTVEVVALCRRRRLPWSEILALLGITSVVTCKWLMLSLDLPRTFTPWIYETFSRQLQPWHLSCFDSWIPILSRRRRHKVTSLSTACRVRDPVPDMHRHLGGLPPCQPSSESATRLEVCYQIQNMQPSGSGCATKFSVSHQVQSVLINIFRVCFKVQGGQPGN